jgi:hypothetical protein
LRGGYRVPSCTEDFFVDSDSSVGVVVSVASAVASTDEDEPHLNITPSMPSGGRRLGLVCFVVVVAVALLLAGLALLIVWAVLYKGTHE